MQQMMSAMLRQFSTIMRAHEMRQMGAERRVGNELELLPPGTLPCGQSPHPKLASLADASRGPATPSPRSSVESPVGDGGRKAAGGEGATPPRCLAILDQAKEEDEPLAGTAAAMRGAIVKNRASLIADRAKKAADVKAAYNCGDNRFTFL